MQTTKTKWTSEAGPRQTKAVNEAIGKLQWRGKTRIEWTDYGRRELTSFMGEVSPEAIEALETIGARYDYKITRANYSEIVQALQEATAALVLPVDDVRSTDAERQEREEQQRKQHEEMERKAQASKDSIAAIMAKKPAWAEALIVAECDENDSDSMTDYFNHKTGRRVAIGWRRGKREDFRQLRAAAAAFEPTAHMGPGLGIFTLRSVWAENCPEYTHYKGAFVPGYELDGKTYQTRAEAEAAIANNTEDMRLSYQCSELRTGLVEYRVIETEIEHRENYSMGAGNYLKAGNDDSDGWRVRSYSIGSFSGYVIEDAIAEPKTETKTATSGAGYEIQQHYHTKRQCDIWAVVLTVRVDRAEFETLRDSAKSAGGWWSNKWGTFPGGFCFDSESAATDWAVKTFGGGEGAELPSEPQPTSPAKLDTLIAENLRSAADNLQDKIEERTRPMSQNYTPKRGREYNSRCHEGDNLKRCQKAMRALADLHESNACPANLKGLRTKAQILPLVTTSGDSQGYYDYRDSGKYRDTSELGKALQALIDETAEEKRQRELTYKLQELQRSNIDGFFPTPRTVALQMVELADIREGMVVLEPSAGAGHLADVIREQTKGALLCCERMHTLREVLKLKGHALTEVTDFLEFEPRGDIDRAILNPPFENSQDATHVLHAYKCLADGGRLVAIVSAGLLFRSDRKATEFREWMKEVGAESIPLPDGSFDTAEAFCRTGVSASIIVANK